ncbi:Hypothetical protein CINCED_3A020441 [Cinara cedri]|uniref:Uncharacterized protein n=1 Tax=Cinara cedri TaxID=506608 RepID=A0A5E4N1T9_9HEMI|nr:Hypothetical protein CINCED_3A020441 [Cinara cedri]
MPRALSGRHPVRCSEVAVDDVLYAFVFLRLFRCRLVGKRTSERNPREINRRVRLCAAETETAAEPLVSENGKAPGGFNSRGYPEIGRGSGRSVPCPLRILICGRDEENAAPTQANGIAPPNADHEYASTPGNNFSHPTTRRDDTGRAMRCDTPLRETLCAKIRGGASGRFQPLSAVIRAGSKTFFCYPKNGLAGTLPRRSADKRKK